jgi:hypothetical protein
MVSALACATWPDMDLHRKTLVRVARTIRITVSVAALVNKFLIQFFGGKRVDKSLLQFGKPASGKALSALPII